VERFDHFAAYCLRTMTRSLVHSLRSLPLAALLLVVPLIETPGFAGSTESVTLVTDRDNTLIEDPASNLSLGTSYYFYVGRVGPNGNGTIRRGVIRFDVESAVPTGATIISAALTLHCSQSGGGGSAMTTLHRLLSDWGEEDSFGFGGGGTFAEPGDATWLHTFHPTEFWNTPGGDFVESASASRLVGGIGFYTWDSTPELVADVQSWLDDPASNFGWAVRGNESVMQTVKKIDARESPTEANWPRLLITYELPATNPADLNGDGVVDGADLGILLKNWGGRGLGDLNDDGVVDGSDLGILLEHWS